MDVHGAPWGNPESQREGGEATHFVEMLRTTGAPSVHAMTGIGIID
jgi:hypothetical protein